MGPGEEIDVPAGVPHLWWNDGPEQAHVILEFRPAETIDAFFETLFGLSRDGKLRIEREGDHPKARPKNLIQAVPELRPPDRPVRCSGSDSARDLPRVRADRQSSRHPGAYPKYRAS
jgi:hypothetical protein